MHNGDAVAEKLVHKGIAELADCVQAVAAELDFREAFELVVVGGLAQAEPMIMATLTSVLAHRNVPCRVLRPELSPVHGACLLGLNLGSVDVSP